MFFNNYERLQGKKVKGFTFFQQIGRGNFGRVYQGQDETGKQVAIKTIQKKIDRQRPQLLRQQIRLLSLCNNQNIIKFIDTFQTEKHKCIVMEFCNGGDMDNLLYSQKNPEGRLAEDMATMFLKQLINGFKGLHEKKIMHRDFKLANIMLHNGVCKIADLGIAKLMELSVAQSFKGTPLTMAPQVLDHQPYRISADVWSLGVVFYNMLFGEYPYSGGSIQKIREAIQNNKINYRLKNIKISDVAKDFIEKCLVVDPKKRITWTEIYKHKLIVSQEQIVYGTQSIIDLSKNVQFYTENDDCQVITNTGKGHRVQEKIQQNQNLQIIELGIFKLALQEFQKKKKEDQGIRKYQQMYLNKRNNIMFIFKHITPYLKGLQDFKKSHSITLFLIIKKAYHQMQKFLHQIIMKIDATQPNNYKQYFDAFLESLVYAKIATLLQKDILTIREQLIFSQSYIEHCSKQVTKQRNFQQIFSKDWNKLVNQQIKSSQLQLVQHIQLSKYQKYKFNLIKVYKAFIYLRKHTSAELVEKFEKQIQKIDYAFQESIMKERAQKIVENESPKRILKKQEQEKPSIKNQSNSRSIWEM